MNIKQIRELAQILSDNELSALEFTEGETRIRMERGSGQNPPAQNGITAKEQTVSNISAQAEARDAGVDFNNLTEVKSPLVGVFYGAPSPEADPFVKVGSAVTKGDVLCIVEAMKLMNEIVAEQEGTVVDICAHNGDIVEFGQTLFKLS